MQELHLVVTYEAATQWQIFMPDSIRKVLQNVSLETNHAKSEIPASLREKGDNINLIDILEQFLRFQHIPSEDLAKMVLTNKKKSGLLYFEELEKMAQEIAEELLVELMKL